MKTSIRYSKNFIESPITFWTRGLIEKPRPTLAGYRRYFVEIQGFEFQFASLDEISVCINTLSHRILPAASPNQHWISHLPGCVKNGRFRQKAVKALKEALTQFCEMPDPRPQVLNARRQGKDELRAIPQFLKKRMQKKKGRD